MNNVCKMWRGYRPALPAITLFFLLMVSGARAASVELLNVSYDPTRELYREINEAFTKYWRATHNQRVVVRQSHGGSGSQARAVINGLEADVVTLALAADVDAIAEHAALLPKEWQQRLPHNSAPYVSTLAFLVRTGNPKNIKSWEDLARADVQVITPNPKTSGVARWNYLALWGYVLRQELGPDCAAKLNDPAQAAAVQAAHNKARIFVTRVFKNVPVLDSGARGATNTFVQRRLGDVLINWENEIYLSKNEFAGAGVEVVVPAISILAEPVVALVDRNVERKKTGAIAQAYLEFLYSDNGQAIAAKNYYRPVMPQIAAKYNDRFPPMELFTINDYFGGWRAANAIHFVDGGEFDRIFAP